MDKLQKYLAVIVFLSAIILIVLLTTWSIYPYKVITIKEVQIENQTVLAGDEVIIRLVAEKHMNVPALVIREIQNDHAWSLPSFTSNAPSETTDWSLRVKIPVNAPSGNDYRVHTTYSYQVNPIRKVYVEWTTPRFTVVANNAMR